MTRILATLATALAFSAGVSGQTSPEDLIRAVRRNDLASLKAQLDKGADVNARDSRDNTLLLYAAGYGTAEAVELLLARGVDVQAKNQFDATALLWGAADPRKARLLVEHGAPVNAASKSGRTPLMVAATCDGCAETVRLLLAKGAAVNARDQRGITALELAADANDLETIRVLMDHGADPVSPNLGGYTPLMFSAANCNLPAVRLLLAKHANVNATNTFANEVKFGKIQLIHLSPLMFAAPHCSADVLKTLLDAGASINEKDSRDMTPLMFAVASEHQDLAVVDLLLKSGAELNAKSNMGETALDWARKFGDSKVIAALTAAGARPGDPFIPPQHKAAEPRSPSQAAHRALTLLQSSTTEFFRQSGCIGCHHQPIATMAFSSAHTLGLPLNNAAAQEHLNMIRQLEIRLQEPKLERIAPGGQTDTPAYSLLALGIAKAPRTDGAEANAVYIAGAQHRDGSWRLNGNSRAPMQESVIGRTAIALRALQLYAPPAQKAEMDQRIARGSNFLLAAKAATNDDFAMQMLGLRWTGAAAARVEAVGQALIAQQHPDGGWAQNRNLASDAYATSQTLWALLEAGLLTPTSPAYQRGVQYLLKTQWPDGSWYVRSRAVKLQPYFQSGFPYDHDQWISAAATGYAVMALAAAGESSDPKTTAAR